MDMPSRALTFRERTFPEKLRWLAEKLDRDGEDEIVRFGIGSALIAIAADLEHNQEQFTLGSSDEG